MRIDRRGPRAPEGTPLFRNADHRWKDEAAAAMRGVPMAAVRRRTELELAVRGREDLLGLCHGVGLMLRYDKSRGQKGAGND